MIGSLDKQPERSLPATGRGEPAEPYPPDWQESSCRRTATQPDYKGRTSEARAHAHTHARTRLRGLLVFPLQSSAVSSTLADLKVALQDLSGELRQERQGSQELTQQFAKAKASWEVERTELKSLITQVRRKKCCCCKEVSKLIIRTLNKNVLMRSSNTENAS